VYDRSQPVTIDGVVAEFAFGNPHPHVVLTSSTSQVRALGGRGYPGRTLWQDRADRLALFTQCRQRDRCSRMSPVFGWTYRPRTGPSPCR
jgi:hypothetical protein